MIVEKWLPNCASSTEEVNFTVLKWSLSKHWVTSIAALLSRLEEIHSSTCLVHAPANASGLVLQMLAKPPKWRAQSIFQRLCPNVCLSLRKQRNKAFLTKCLLTYFWFGCCLGVWCLYLKFGANHSFPAWVMDYRNIAKRCCTILVTGNQLMRWILITTKLLFLHLLATF